jgi:hypothetical protein
MLWTIFSSMVFHPKIAVQIQITITWTLGLTLQTRKPLNTGLRWWALLSNSHGHWHAKIVLRMKTWKQPSGMRAHWIACSGTLEPHKGPGFNPVVCRWNSCQPSANELDFRFANGLSGQICCYAFFKIKIKIGSRADYVRIIQQGSISYSAHAKWIDLFPSY